MSNKASGSGDVLGCAPRKGELTNDIHSILGVTLSFFQKGRKSYLQEYVMRWPAMPPFAHRAALYRG